MEGKLSKRLLLKFQCEMEKEAVHWRWKKKIYMGIKDICCLFLCAKFELESRVFVREVVKLGILSSI